jgi:hypothetical protein
MDDFQEMMVVERVNLDKHIKAACSIVALYNLRNLLQLLNKEHFPQVELSYEDAIRYLRKEAVNLPADTPKGYVLVTYRQVPIGWEKNIGNRANNLYPQEWKIKSSHGTGSRCP